MTSGSQKMEEPVLTLDQRFSENHRTSFLTMNPGHRKSIFFRKPRSGGLFDFEKIKEQELEVVCL
jgi:hypothetical protein